MPFIPFAAHNIKHTDWIGSIEISPPLTLKEASYLSKYLNTWHFKYSNKTLEGLYGVHEDKKIEEGETTNNGSYLIRKSKQDTVPSLIAPLVLGSNDWNKQNVVNCIGLKTHIKGLGHSASWILFLIEHFFKKDAYAKHLFKDTFGEFPNHVCNGSILYRDASRDGACTEIKVVNNYVTQVGIKKTYMLKQNDGFKDIDYPVFLRSILENSEKELRKIGFPNCYISEKSLKEQDHKMKIKDILKNVAYEAALYKVFTPEITITDNLRIEYEQYYMDNEIPYSTLQGNGKINKF